MVPAVLHRFVPMFLLLTGCAVSDGTDASDEAVPPSVDSDPSDLIPDGTGKADGWAFAASDVMDDVLFEDAGYMTVDDIQAFLEATPYGRPTFLATHRVGQRTVAQAVVDAAWRYDINPLVLLAKLQVEMGLLGKVTKPSTRRVDFAMGCGCPDNRPCDEDLRGLDKQLVCAAERFRSYLSDLDSKGVTIAGWRVGRSKKTLDPIRVTPKNRATAALYTYTPWVLTGTGGNWLFWNVYRKYSRHFLDNTINHRWIGADCSTDDDCGDPEGFCGNGRCTVACDQFCPDSRAPNVTTSFCVQGACLARCDVGLFSENGGCSTGSACEQAPRHNDPDTIRSVCLPATP